MAANWPGKRFVITWEVSSDMPQDALDAGVAKWDDFNASFNLDDTLPQDENGDIVYLHPVDKDAIPPIQGLPAATGGKKIVLQRYWPANLPDTPDSASFSDKWNAPDDPVIGLEARKAAFQKVKDAIEAMCDTPNWAALYSEEKLKSLKNKMNHFVASDGIYAPGGFQSEYEDEDGQALPTTGAQNFLFEFYFGYVPAAGDKGLGKNTLNDLVFGPRKE